MRQIDFRDLVYRHFYGRQQIHGTHSWPELQEELVEEVRTERQYFYGTGWSRESQYCGLDYKNKGHRLRLGRFPAHAKLFSIFDELELLDYEIYNLCTWEGTLWAKESHEFFPTAIHRRHYMGRDL